MTSLASGVLSSLTVRIKIFQGLIFFIGKKKKANKESVQITSFDNAIKFQEKETRCLVSNKQTNKQPSKLKLIKVIKFKIRVAY